MWSFSFLPSLLMFPLAAGLTWEVFVCRRKTCQKRCNVSGTVAHYIFSLQHFRRKDAEVTYYLCVQSSLKLAWRHSLPVSSLPFRFGIFSPSALYLASVVPTTTALTSEFGDHCADVGVPTTTALTSECRRPLRWRRSAEDHCADVGVPTTTALTSGFRRPLRWRGSADDHCADVYMR